MLFSMLGIGSYGVREIARCNNDRIKRDEVFTNLFVFHVITTVIGLLILWVCIFTISKLSPYRPFLLIGSVNLVFSLFHTNWFFQGISDFKFITIRSLILRIISVILLFVFVRDKSDTLNYYSLACLTTVLTAIINWKYGRQYRKIIFSQIHLKRYIYPVFVFGIYLILTSAYTTFNTVFLGFCAGDTEVGYFATATKLYTILLSALTAFTTVMVPKVSELMKKGNKDYIQSLLTDILSLVVIFSIPIVVFCNFFAEEIILIIAGEGYMGAVAPFKIVIFLLIVIGFEQIIIQQFLMASQSYNSILWISLIGALVGISLNCILTPTWASVGSSLSWGISEFCVLMTGLYFLHRVVHVQMDFLVVVKKFAHFVYYILPLVFVSYIDTNMWIKFFISSILVLLIFMFINLLVEKNRFVVSLANKISPGFNVHEK